jgi:uncharacterized membrane protein YkvA (DUF1232 family)
MSRTEPCGTISLVGGYLDLAGASFSPPEHGIAIDAGRLAEFNAVLREISPDAPEVDLALVQRMAAELAANPRSGQASVRRRLETVEALRRMAADAAWRLPGEDAGRIELALRYLAREDDLIPDATPGIGLLDDAIVIELARRAVAAELRDYADFCRFRDAEAAVAGVPVARVEVDRRDWLAWKRTLEDLDAARGIERTGTGDTPGSYRRL